MKQTLLLISFISLGFSTIFGQVDFPDININELFLLEVDSFEIRKINNKGHKYTNYFLHYTITNISEDTLLFATSDCPHYNQYIFEMNDTMYYPNSHPGIGCLIRGGRFYELLPNKSFSDSEEMLDDFSNLSLDKTDLVLTMPIGIRTQFRFEIDGHRSSDNLDELIFEGEILIIENDVVILSKR